MLMSLVCEGLVILCGSQLRDWLMALVHFWGESAYRQRKNWASLCAIGLAPGGQGMHVKYFRKQMIYILPMECQSELLTLA
jgi:hypothetical protein